MPVLYAPRIERPSRQHAGKSRYVRLGVAAIDSERMELHQLPSVVFIEARDGFSRSWDSRPRIRDWGGGKPVIEVEQHRGMPRGLAKEIAKAAHNIGPDGVTFIISNEDVIQTLSGDDVEMIVPKVDHHLLELARALDRWNQSQLAEMDGHFLVEGVAPGEAASRRAAGSVLHRGLDHLAIGRDEIGLRHLALGQLRQTLAEL